MGETKRRASGQCLRSGECNEKKKHKKKKDEIEENTQRLRSGECNEK
jgi:hypothetical protein